LHPSTSLLKFFRGGKKNTYSNINIKLTDAQHRTKQDNHPTEDKQPEYNIARGRMTNSPVVVRRAVRPEDLPPAFVSRPAAYLSSLFENGGPGTVVLLAQGSIWELEAILKIAVNDAELATEGIYVSSFFLLLHPILPHSHYKTIENYVIVGYPTDPNLHAQVHSVGEGEATAIFFHNTSHVKLSHLTIDGRRPDKGWVDGGGPLIACGGREGKDPVVQYCIIRHPRGWSSLQVRASFFLFIFSLHSSIIKKMFNVLLRIPWT
jgi:hypothetical protein